jgi:transposase InsO family protein
MKHLYNRLSWQTAWQIVGQVAIKQLPIPSGMRSLGVSRAHLYRLARRWLEWNQKTPSPEWLNKPRPPRPSRLPLEVQSFLREEITYLTEKSVHFRGHFNFTFLAQRCLRHFKRSFSRESIRRWAIREQLFKPDTHSTGKALTRFDVGAVGELFQHDSSHHLWVPAANRTDILILTIDDHSRKIVGARLVPHDTSWHHLCVVRNTIETYGRPTAYYTDNAQIFRSDTDIHAQFARALYDLKIDPRLTGKAHPQAKGKVEKRFDYLQRRIPLLCERYRIRNLTAANKILDDEVAFFNECHIHAETNERPDKRWERAVREGRCHLRPLPPKVNLDIIFGLQWERKMKSDGSFSFEGQILRVPSGPRLTKVAIVLHPPFRGRTHSQLSVLWKGGCVGQFIKPAGQISWQPV